MFAAAILTAAMWIYLATIFRPNKHLTTDTNFGKSQVEISEMIPAKGKNKLFINTYA